MWYHIKAKDIDIDNPNGQILTFWLWANNKKDLDDILSKKDNIVDIQWIKQEKPPFE